MRRSYRDPGWWGASRHQGGDELAEEGPAAAAGVVHELEEGEVERQLLLRDAPVRAQPRAQQRPDPLRGVDVDLAEPVAIVIARVLAPGRGTRPRGRSPTPPAGRRCRTRRCRPARR